MDNTTSNDTVNQVIKIISEIVLNELKKKEGAKSG